MNYIIYQTTNNINGKIYIGSHKTNDIEDGYMGSGKLLHRAITKYGIENFSREVLYSFDNSEEMFNKETELVNEDFVKCKDTYNIKIGGFGGWDHINDGSTIHKEICRKGRRATNKILEQKHGKDWNAIVSRMSHENRTPESYSIVAKKTSATIKRRYGSKWTFGGKQHTAETKLKMSKSSKGMGTGDQNSQFGTCWIHNLEFEQSKKINPDELQTYVQDGWIKGRKIKF